MSGQYVVIDDELTYYVPESVLKEMMERLEEKVLYGEEKEKEPLGIVRPAWEGIEIKPVRNTISECSMEKVFAEDYAATDEVKDMLKGFEMTFEVEVERTILEEIMAAGGNIGERKPNRAERRNNGKRYENKSGSKFKGSRDERYGSPLFRGIPKRGRSGSKAVRSRTRNRS